MQLEQNGPVTPPLAQAEPEQRVYYSPRAGLTITINPGQRLMSNGNVITVGFKEIGFTPQGDNWGRLVTRDPEVIEYMEKRRVEQGDVFDAKAYVEKTTPDHVRAEQAQNELKRVLTDQNRLLARIAELEAQKRPGQPIPAK